MKGFLKKNLEPADVPEIRAMLIFTGDGVELEPGDSPIPAMKLKQVKDFLRQESKRRALSSEHIAKIAAILPD